MANPAAEVGHGEPERHPSSFSELTQEGEEADATTRENALQIHIGERVRERRVMAGLSQTKLGKKLGVSFQQIQKYERGTNSLSAGRIFNLAKILGVDVEYFFAGFHPPDRPKANSRLAEEEVMIDEEVSLQVYEVARRLQQIRNPAVRRALMGLVKAVCHEDDVLT